MKRALILIALLVSATFFGMEVSNGVLTLKWENDCLAVYANGSKQPDLSFSVGPGFTAMKVASKTPAIILRSGNRMVNFQMERAKPKFTMFTFENAPEVTMSYPGRYLILPDPVGDDAVFTPGKSPLRVPGFRPLALLAGGNGDSVLSIISYSGATDYRLSADFQKVVFPQCPGLGRVFSLLKRPGAWHEVKAPLNPLMLTEIKNWTRPYPAKWRAAIPQKDGYLKSGDNLWSIWGVIYVDEKNRPHNHSRRGNVTRVNERRTWYSGFEGIQKYPVEFTSAGQLLLKYPNEPPNRRLKADVSRPVLVYAWEPDSVPADVFLPIQALDDTLTGYFSQRNTPWVRFFPATCGTTAKVEQHFYREEAGANAKLIASNLALMDSFLLYIRSRIFVLKTTLDNLGKQHGLPVSLKEAINEGQAVFTERKKDFDQLDAALAASDELAKLAQKSGDSEELENQAKALGKKIRTFGGMQDNLSANLRHAVKNIRTLALKEYMRSETPAERDVLTRVFNDTETPLMQPATHEGK